MCIRDSLIPDRARERILDIAATQFEDGSAYHQYQPLTKKGNSDIGSGFNDDPLWLIAGTAAYIKETGDYSILDEMTPYDSDASKATTFMEHLRRSFHYTMEHLGPHNLPLIGRADWNDCLNLNCFSTEPGESFQTFGPSEGPNAESVFIAGMFVRYGKDYAAICRHQGMTEEAELAEKLEISTTFGETLSWKYLCYVREHPVSWKIPTRILYGEKDDLTSMETIKAFAKKNNAELTVMPGGEHWFHTKEQMQFLDNWIKNRRPCNETENKDGFACL